MNQMCLSLPLLGQKFIDIEQAEQQRVELEEDNEIIYFNVSGKKFATFEKTLGNLPNSLLGNKWSRMKLKKNQQGEIFLNRNARVFESVLTFYQTGIFEPPDRVNHNIFTKDIIYYDLAEEAMECGMQGFHLAKPPSPKNKFQAYVWQVLERPDSSLAARLFSLASLLVIVASIIIFCWGTLPAYRQPEHETPPSIKTIKLILRDIEIFCICWFTVELLLRFGFSPDKCSFVKDVLNIIDVVSILPFYITLFGISAQYFLRAIRLVRVFRVFKLSRHLAEMKILGNAVRDSVRELGVLVFFILLGVLLFSSAVFYAEQGNPQSHLQSIPGAFWWSIVTMTTVGYGDEVPVTVAGRVVGAACAMTGILVIALPIPIIVNNFTRQYQLQKPVSRYWREIEAKEKQGPAKEIVSSLFRLMQSHDTDYGVVQPMQRRRVSKQQMNGKISNSHRRDTIQETACGCSRGKFSVEHVPNVPVDITGTQDGSQVALNDSISPWSHTANITQEAACECTVSTKTELVNCVESQAMSDRQRKYSATATNINVRCVEGNNCNQPSESQTSRNQQERCMNFPQSETKTCLKPVVDKDNVIEHTSSSDLEQINLAIHSEINTNLHKTIYDVMPYARMNGNDDVKLTLLPSDDQLSILRTEISGDTDEA